MSIFAEWNELLMNKETNLEYTSNMTEESIPKFLDVASEIGIKEAIFLFKKTYISEHEIYLHC